MFFIVFAPFFSILGNKFVIVSLRTDPNPLASIWGINSDDTVILTHSRRP